MLSVALGRLPLHSLETQRSQAKRSPEGWELRKTLEQVQQPMELVQHLAERLQLSQMAMDRQR